MLWAIILAVVRWSKSDNFFKIYLCIYKCMLRKYKSNKDISYNILLVYAWQFFSECSAQPYPHSPAPAYPSVKHMAPADSELKKRDPLNSAPAIDICIHLPTFIPSHSPKLLSHGSQQKILFHFFSFLLPLFWPGSGWKKGAGPTFAAVSGDAALCEWI